MTIPQIIGAGLFVFAALIVIAHYRFDWIKKHQVVETIANAAGFVAFVLAIIIFVLPDLSSSFLSKTEYFEITKTIPLSSRKELNQDQKKFLAQETAAIIARASLAASVKSHIVSHAKVTMGELTEQQISSKVNVALALSEVVEGKFLADGRYQITMRVPKSKPKASL